MHETEKKKSQQGTGWANGTQRIILFTMFPWSMIRILIRPIYDGQIITMSASWMDSVTCKRPIHNLHSAIVHSFGHRQRTFSHPLSKPLIVRRWNTTEEHKYVKHVVSNKSWDLQLFCVFFSLDIHLLKRCQLKRVERVDFAVFNIPLRPQLISSLVLDSFSDVSS